MWPPELKLISNLHHWFGRFPDRSFELHEWFSALVLQLKRILGSCLAFCCSSHDTRWWFDDLGANEEMSIFYTFICVIILLLTATIYIHTLHRDTQVHNSVYIVCLITHMNWNQSNLLQRAELQLPQVSLGSVGDRNIQRSTRNKD